MSVVIPIAIYIVLFVITITVHELSHGVVAYSLGDRTAKLAGRLTLNPLKHIDPFWTVLFPVMMLFAGLPAIGMAKPVPVNAMNLPSPRRDMIWVALAGPVSNLALAAFFSLGFKLTGHVLFVLGFYLNVGLALFNMIPIPPLDGSRLVAGIIPLSWARAYGQVEQYGFWILFILVWFGTPWKLIIPIFNSICRMFEMPVMGDLS